MNNPRLFEKCQTKLDFLLFDLMTCLLTNIKNIQYNQAMIV